MRLSVAMCTYNGAAYLREQLEGIAAQTRLPDELVVCDDASRDETTQIVREFAARAPFPVYLHVNERNLGSTKNFEQAIRLCGGDLIALSDQDDVWNAPKLARLEAAFVASPDAGLVFSDAELVTESLQPLGCRMWESVGFDGEKRRLLAAGRAVEVLLPGWTVTGATMAFRAEFRELVLPIPTDLPMIHDGWIALMIATVADVTFVEAPLIKYRQHPRQQIGAPEKKAPTDEDEAWLNPRVVENSLRRTNSYAELLEIIQAANLRLKTQGAGFNAARARENLESMMIHIRARAYLPQQKLRRLPCVFRELLTGRYHRYSNGASSAVKDLVSGVVRGSA